jgi:hypothetical protein
VVTELLARVRRALTQLELISEAPASKPLDSDRVRGGDTSGDMPTEQRSLLDRHVAWLQEWVIRAEHDCERQKFRPPNAPKGETPAQFAERIVREHEGRHDLWVAKHERASRSYIRQIRQRAGRDPLYGRPSSD